MSRRPAFAVSIAVFAFGMSTGFTDGVATSLVVLLVSRSFVLAPALVLPPALPASPHPHPPRSCC